MFWDSAYPGNAAPRCATGIGLALAAALLCPAPAHAWSLSDQKAGAREHPQMVARYGGSYDDDLLAAYVEDIGFRLVAVSDRPREDWVFTILDSPEVNAFALPGGYVYVTRGLLALANSEAELAGVLAHEVAHLTLDHVQDRNDRGAKAGIGVIAGAIIGGVLGGKDGARDALKAGSAIAAGYLARHTRAEELEADRTGIRLMAALGYDPMAQADFLESLEAQYKLNAALQGAEHDPNRVGFFDSHPATARRVREAVEEAGLAATGGTLNEAAYLDRIDGMIYGDSPGQGFVRDREFLHPLLRFAFTVPEGFTILNAPRQVVARGRGGAMMVMDAIRDPGPRLDSYIKDVWGPDLTRGVDSGYMYDLHRLEINGLSAATGFQPFEDRDGRKVAQLTVIRLGDRYYRIRAIAPAEDIQTSNAMGRATETFRGLTASEAESLQPLKLKVYRIRPGDDLILLSATMPLQTMAQERFQTLNGYAPDEVPLVGDLVKLVVE